MRAIRNSRPSRFATAGLLLLGLLWGCHKSAGRPPAGNRDSGPWVVFRVVERGTGEPLEGFVWADGYPGDFETVDSRSSSGHPFEGLGKGGDGYVVPFQRHHPLRLFAWSPGHELASVVLVPVRGENLVVFELFRVQVEDERVPEEIRIEVPQYQPTEGPRSGT